MTDKELLLAAAKSAGFVEPVRATDASLMWVSQSGFPSIWRPLEDNADAFKLMVQLKMDVLHGLRVTAIASQEARVHEEYNGDPLAATRRAIVRAAAAIGEKE